MFEHHHNILMNASIFICMGILNYDVEIQIASIDTKLAIACDC